jgi:glycosyltransferase involved in cell wall biosynthesis
MLVSVIVPSFNQGKYIRETIDSILAQDHRPIEIIVFDGGSKDETVDVLRSYGAREELQWISEPDRGVVDAVNKGLAKARGAIQAIQSSDDTYLPGAITRAVQAITQSDAGLVYGDVEYIDASSKKTSETHLAPFDLADYVGKRTFIPQPSAFFTKAAADAIGGWRAEISYAADADFYLRIATHFRTIKLDALLAQYRYHEEQRDRAGTRIARDWEQCVRDWLAREHPSPLLRKRARSGIHITNAHYMSDAQWMQRTIELYRALMIEPSLIARDDFPRRELIPGRTPIWQMLSRIKRLLRSSL